jgi:hypothetical protein
MLRPTEGETGRDRDRIVNLSDGVFAITLPILDRRAPDIPENLMSSQLPGAMLSLWPKYLGYMSSFVGISALWLIHQSIFRHSQVLTWWFAYHVPEKLRNEVVRSPRSIAADAALGMGKGLDERDGPFRVSVP